MRRLSSRTGSIATSVVGGCVFPLYPGLTANHPASLESARRWVNVSPQQQRKWQNEFQSSTKVSEYDFDKERWAKQMKMATLDCILEPDISFPATMSFQGLKRKFRQWLTNRKVMERRPKFKPDELKEVYIRYKTLGHSKNQEDGRLLHRVTTHAEAVRLESLLKKQLNSDFKEKSWKAMKLDDKSTYNIDVESCEILNCYLGNLVKEDWVQFTCRVQSMETMAEGQEPQRLVEYAVFEICLGDGLNSSMANSWIIVGIMNEDGVRYGKDGQDASELRKSIAKSNRSWFG